jgi:hypothetical protein
MLLEREKTAVMATSASRHVCGTNGNLFPSKKRVHNRSDSFGNRRADVCVTRSRTGPRSRSAVSSGCLQTSKTNERCEMGSFRTAVRKGVRTPPSRTISLGNLEEGDGTKSEYGNDPDTCLHQREGSFDRACGVLNGSGKVLAPSHAVPAIVWRQVGGDEEEQVQSVQEIEKVPVHSARTCVR